MGAVMNRSRIKHAIAVDRRSIAALLGEAAGISFPDADGGVGHRAGEWHDWRTSWLNGLDYSLSARGAFDAVVIADEFLDYVPRAAHSRVPSLEVTARRAMGRCAAAAQYWRESVDADAEARRCLDAMHSSMADVWSGRAAEARDRCRCAIVEAIDAIANYRFQVRKQARGARKPSTQED